MSTTLTVESIQQAALELQPSARLQLTHALVQSLAALPEAEVGELWLAEAERRDAEMESGQVRGIPGEEVFRRLYARYGK
ncbi:MAG TPA: addiction module protein [Thermoanaerobaculia bacterium]|nr:addiction module protein [Thermoanaerobaculia bacterium]